MDRSNEIDIKNNNIVEKLIKNLAKFKSIENFIKYKKLIKN